MSVSEDMSARFVDGDDVPEGMIFPISASRSESVRDRVDSPPIEGDPIILSFEAGRIRAAMTPRDKMNQLLQNQLFKQRSKHTPDLAPIPTIHDVQAAIDQLTILSEDAKATEFMISTVLDVFVMVTRNCPPLSKNDDLNLKIGITIEFLRRKVINHQCAHELVECFNEEAEAEWVS